MSEAASAVRLSGVVRSELARIGREIAAAERVLAFTGAGISTESGLPDYRGASGLWRNRRFEELAHLETFEREPAEFWQFYGERLAALRQAAPNAAHRALARLEREGLLAAVVTQNVDGLHRAAGSVAVVELHGTLREAVCLACGAREPIAEVEERLAAAPDGVPRCDCGSPLKPAVVLFGEYLPAGALEDALVFARGADYLLCLGSSLQVMPAAAIPQLVLDNGGRAAIINQGSTPYDDRPGVRRVEAPLAVALPVVLEAALAAR